MIQKYPGAPLSQIKNWNKALEKQKTIEAGEYLASPQEKEEALRNAAVAKRGLAKAEEIDTGRAYGNIGSKILAALSVGLGSYASSRGGGRNTALEALPVERRVSTNSLWINTITRNLRLCQFPLPNGEKLLRA